MLSPGVILKGKYEIIRQIGKGGMSTVWLCNDLDLSKVWAVKEIDKSTDAFKASVNADGSLTEIEILKSIDHPAAPRIVDIYETSESLCVVMDYIEGESLQSVLNREKALSCDAAAGYMIEVLKLLHYLHKRHIIYRDMKPANIVLSKTGVIKVIDFGIAKEVKNGIYEDTSALGTRGYASPEAKKRYSDERSDIYTVGISLFQLLTDISPVKNDFTVVPIRSINPALSSGLEEIILKATEADPKKRYAQASEMMDALKNYKKLEKPYLNKLKRKLFVSSLLGSAAALCITSGLGLLGADFAKGELMYRDLINAGALSNKELTENYINAASLKPGRSEAYFLLIDLYKNAGMDEASLSKITELYEGYSKAAFLKGRDFKDLSHEVAMDVFIYKNGSPYERLKDAESYLNASGLETDKSFLAIKSFYEAETLTKSDKESFINLAKALMANADLMIGKDSGLYKAKLYELIIDFASTHSGLEEVKALAESKLQGGAL